MDKVYCKNCKWDSTFEYDWFVIRRTVYNHNVCRRNYNKIIRQIEPIVWKEELNEEGNCPHYLKKRYKFWVKK